MIGGIKLKEYTEAKLEIIKFDAEDVITTSGGLDDQSGGDE